MERTLYRFYDKICLHKKKMASEHTLCIFRLLFLEIDFHTYHMDIGNCKTRAHVKSAFINEMTLHLYPSLSLSIFSSISISSFICIFLNFELHLYLSVCRASSRSPTVSISISSFICIFLNLELNLYHSLSRAQ